METESGFYLLDAFEDVLYVRSFGSWDDRTARAFVGDLKEKILSSFAQRRWCALHDARQWQLGIPEVEAIVATFATSPLTGRLTHHAIVTGPSELKKWQVDKMFNTISAYEHGRFDDVKKAREWLMAAGYTIPDL